ncbi:MAG TPA: hypothetical protein VLW17_15105 [Thermoanaerobaculaceae bacterium]|nr:hypothetical protein [Thermoanaerobaculaceae bacterium]
MPWLLDGNNLASGGDRERVRRAVLAVARGERVRMVLFFDGAPPAGSGERERLGPVEVRYVADADRAILELLGAGGRGWRLATDDRRLAMLARASGAAVVPAAAFWEKASAAESGAGESAQRPVAPSGGRGYAEGVERLPESPRRVPRRPLPARGKRR